MTTDLILTVRPNPDGEVDAAALTRRGVPALASPVMEAVYSAMPETPAAGSVGGVIFTSRHAIEAFLDVFDGVLPADWTDSPVFVVGRASGRVARQAGFNDVTVGAGGGAGLTPRILARRDELAAPLLWPCAVDRGFDMAAALAPDIAVTTSPVYEMKAVPRLQEAALDALHEDRVRAVILMSARSARLFRGQLVRHDLEDRIAGMTLIAGSDGIAAAAGPGWDRHFVARRPTRARLLAIAALFYHRRPAPE